MRCVLAFVVASAVLACASRSVNYCGAKMCSYTNAHTFCRYPPGPSPNCRGYMDGLLTADEKVRIVARLNRRRSEAASGRLRRLGTAGNMLKLRWVEELAREAQRWADQCRPPGTPDERDTCRDLYSTTVGQCVASVVGEAPGLRVESMVDMWYMQSLLYKGNATYYQIPMSNVSFYGDFTQIIWARSYMVGCGRSKFMSEWNGRMRSVERLVCNIAPRGPPPYRALWAPAAPTSVCPPRSVPDPDLTAMCNYQHDLDSSSDIDGAMTVEEHILLSIVLEIEDKPSLNKLGSLDELYMTKLAVVTMDNRGTTPSYYRQAHKRDIIDTLGLDASVVRIDDVLLENDTNEFINATRIIVSLATETEKIVTKKANLIGRPKSYNIEDLNNADGSNSIQPDLNSHDDLPRQDVSKFDRDLYIEYAMLDDIEEKATIMTSVKELDTTSASTLNILNVIIKENQAIIDTTINTNYRSPSTTENISTKKESTLYNVKNYPEHESANLTDSTSYNIMNFTSIMNITTDATSSDDEYLTDPETVRELQEALERMEKSLEDRRSPGKVRRELRNQIPQESQPNMDIDVSNDDNDSHRNKQEILHNYMNPDMNKTDRSPMLGMVLKYMPYLKPYENEILGTAASTGCTSESSYALFSFVVVLFCL